MPALITHRLFGEESIERLPEGIITNEDERAAFPVSYTHLDVYKRQAPMRATAGPLIPTEAPKSRSRRLNRPENTPP